MVPLLLQTLERIFPFPAPHECSPSSVGSAVLTQHPWLQASISKLRSSLSSLDSEIGFSKIQEGRGGMESVGSSACSEADLDGETRVTVVL